MIFRKTRSVRTHQQPSSKHGIHSRRLIRVSKENLENLNAFRFHCNLCKRWLPTSAFYAQVAHPEGEASDDAVYLARYEVKAEGFKGHETVGVCADCAKGIDQGKIDGASHRRCSESLNPLRGKKSQNEN
jgi:hypothetical protein